MRIDQLIYIVHISRFESISLAAEHLHISQPTISQSVNALEIELNTKIFHRSRNGTFPTEEGKIIIQKAIEILDKIEDMKLLTINHSRLLSGTLSIASLPSFSLNILSKTVALFSNQFSNISVKIKEDSGPNIAEEVKSERVSLGFVAKTKVLTFDEKEFIFEKLANGKVMACVGKKSPLSKCKELSFKEIVKHPIVTFKHKSPLVHQIMDSLENFGEPNIFFNTGMTNEATGKQLLAEGIGVGFCSSVIINSDPYFLANKLVAIPLSEDVIKLDYGCLRLKSRHLSPAANEFFKMLKSNLTDNNLYASLK